LIGASFYLVTQARQFLPHATAARVNDWFASVVRVDDAPWPVEAIARIARGDLLAWMGLVVLSVAIFVAAVRQAQRRFVEVAQTPEADGRVTVVPRTTVEHRFAIGFGHDLFATLLLKEWRLVLRAPQLISQVLLQMLYLFPLIFVGFSHGGTMRTLTGPTLAAGIVAIAATLATSLAWLTISGEDAPDLIASSPRRRSIIVGAKIVAATSPPVLLVLLAAIGIGLHAPVDGALVLLYGVLSCSSAAIIAAASPSPGKRSDFQRRHKGRVGSGLLEMLQFLAWAGAAGTAVAGIAIAAIPLTLLALVAPALLFRRALGMVRDEA
jgi:ABC-2 type transport system permease protein